MVFPCLVYSKLPNQKTFADNGVYTRVQEYQLTLMERDPDSQLGTEIESYFQYCSISSHSVVDGLNHTFINLYY